MKEINLIGGFYKSKTLPWSAQDVVNWAPVPARAGGTRSPLKLRGLPGLKPLTNEVIATLRITGLAPDGVVGTPYSFTYGATGGIPPYSFSLISGSTPVGIPFSGGLVSGTPTTAETKGFRIGVSDSSLQSAEKDDSITIISEPPSGTWVIFGQRPFPNLEFFALNSSDITDIDFSTRESTGSSSTVIVASTNENAIIAPSADLNSVVVSLNRGETWSQPSTASGFGTDISAPVFVGGATVIGRSNTSAQRSTDDGLTWANSGSIGARYLATDGTSIVSFRAASNQCAVSNDGGSTFFASGTFPGPTRPIRSIGYTPGRFIAVGTDGANGPFATKSTNNGSTWSAVSYLPFTNPALALIFAESVMVSGSTVVIASSDGEAVYSTDGGVTFSISGSTGLVSASACWFGGGRFAIAGVVVVDADFVVAISTSTDGETWSLSTISNFPEAASIDAITYLEP